MEYPGFGINFGRGFCSTSQVKHEATVLLDFVRDEMGVPNDNIILFGRSMGTGVAVYLAAEKCKPAAIILVAPYTAIKDVPFPPLTFMLRCLSGHFNSLHIIQKVECPVLIIHGIDDKTIPISHGRKLFEKLAATSRPPSTFKLEERQNCSHIEYSVRKDLIWPTKCFLEEHWKPEWFDEE